MTGAQRTTAMERMYVLRMAHPWGDKHYLLQKKEKKRYNLNLISVQENLKIERHSLTKTYKYYIKKLLEINWNRKCLKFVY